MAWTQERFTKEMRKFDPLLRLRRSADGMWWLIERKAARESKCLIPPKERRGIDAFIRDRDGYVHVMKVRHDLLGQRVFLELRANDMWAFRGAGWYADQLEAQERRQEEIADRSMHGRLQDAGGEAYDRLRVMDGCQKGGFYSKVGGWEPPVSPAKPGEVSVGARGVQ